MPGVHLCHSTGILYFIGGALTSQNIPDYCMITTNYHIQISVKKVSAFVFNASLRIMGMHVNVDLYLKRGLKD